MRIGSRKHWSTLLLSAVLLPALVGCQGAGVGSTSVRIEPGAYPHAFQAVKDELRASGFELDRIDARAGVITTRPRSSAGLATPWIGDESTIGQEFEGALNRQRRTVRVVFTPIEPAGDAVTGDPVDARKTGTALRAEFEVLIERIHRSGFRPSPTSVRLSSVSEVGAGGNDDPEPWTTTVIGKDDQLAARIVRGVTGRVRIR